MTEALTVDELLEQLWKLPALERWQVVRQILARAQPGSQWGALVHLGTAPSEGEIQAVRREVWARFRRENVL